MQRACDEVRHEFDEDTQRVVLVKRRTGPQITTTGDMS
jgi:hypothetical protein